MKNQYTIQEKLCDLRRDHKYKLEYVAEAIQVSTATLSKYENKENKEYNFITLNKLANFYGVSLDWLVCNTDIKESTHTPIEELHLDDETIEILKNGCFNHRLLCEIIKHPNFFHLMTDIEIYIDGHASDHIKKMNDWLDSVRFKVIKQHQAEVSDTFLSILEHQHINEDEFFFHNIHGELDNILRNLRLEHEAASESAPIEREITNADRLNQLGESSDFIVNPAETFFDLLCEQMEIPLERITPEEVTVMQSLFYKSSLFDRIRKSSEEIV